MYHLAVSISDQQLVPSVHLQHCVGRYIMKSAFMYGVQAFVWCHCPLNSAQWGGCAHPVTGATLR